MALWQAMAFFFSILHATCRFIFLAIARWDCVCWERCNWFSSPPPVLLHMRDWIPMHVFDRCTLHLVPWREGQDKLATQKPDVQTHFVWHWLRCIACGCHLHVVRALLHMVWLVLRWPCITCNILYGAFNAFGLTGAIGCATWYLCSMVLHATCFHTHVMHAPTHWCSVLFLWLSKQPCMSIPWVFKCWGVWETCFWWSMSNNCRSGTMAYTHLWCGIVKG